MPQILAAVSKYMATKNVLKLDDILATALV